MATDSSQGTRLVILHGAKGSPLKAADVIMRFFDRLTCQSLGAGITQNDSLDGFQKPLIGNLQNSCLPVRYN